jgi:hypothetical protein
MRLLARLTRNYDYLYPEKTTTPFISVRSWHAKI